MKSKAQAYVSGLLQLSRMAGRPVHMTQQQVYEFISNNGRVFHKPTEAQVVLMEKQICFDNAYRYATQFKLKYCEGYAISHGFPMEHAWCVKGTKVIDPTLGLRGVDYFGCILELDVVDAIRTTAGVTGVFSHKWDVLEPFLTRD
jgi:hypothetical protein